MNDFQRRAPAARRVLRYLLVLRAIRIENPSVFQVWETEWGKRKQVEIDRLIYDSDALSQEEQRTALETIEKRYEAERQKAQDLVRSERYSRSSDADKKKLLDDLVAEPAVG